MSLTSQLDEAEAALLAQIQTQAATIGSALSGVTIELGDPGAWTLAEHVWISEEAHATERWELTGSGAKVRAETFELEVRIIVRQSGDDWTTLRARAHALAEEVETALLNDVTLAGSVWSAQIAGLDRFGGADDAGRLAFVSVRIECTAYLA